ncbi:MAG: peptide maturation system acyl carrier-related protein [Clostridia bacterium]|nr:peptide maturation system acyl carrier-related protein [Clostridia bacterium]
MGCISKDEIAEGLKGIFKRRFGIEEKMWNHEVKNKHLLGKEIRLAPRDLLYVFFDLEKEFNINIPENDIVEGRFNSFENAVDIVFEQLQKFQKG